jgi:hypothetical protein
MRTDCSDRAIGSPSIRRGGRGFSPYALGLFGRSVRESNCDCDRSNEPSLLQTVFLRNDNEVLAMVSNPRFGWVSQIVAQLQPKPQRPARPSAKNPAKAAPPQAMNAKSPTNSSDKNLLAMATPEQKKSVAKDAPPKDPAKKDAARKDLVKKDSAKKDARKPEMFTPEQKTRRIAQLTERIRQLQEKGDAKQVKLLTARLEDLKRQPARARAGAAPVPIPKPSQLPLAKKQELVRTLYLRTLSRYPKDQEFDRALAYLDKSDNVANGLRDLVWAVVNTEEFIVNH